MPKSKLEMHFNSDSGSGNTAPTTATTTIAEPEPESETITNLKEQLEFVRAAIANKTEQIRQQKEENENFAEALRLLREQPKWKPAPGILPVYDNLLQLMEESKSEQQRSQRMQTSIQALELGQARCRQLEAEKESLHQSLLKWQAELSWHQYYEPHAEKYRAAYDFGESWEAKRDAEIAKWEEVLGRHQALLKKAQEAIAQIKLDGTLKNWTSYRSPESIVRDYPKEIAEFQSRIAKLKSATPPPPDPKIEASFRDFVRRRYNLEPYLDSLIEAQKTYLAALTEFRAIAKNSKSTLQFSIEDLPEQIVEVGLDERDRIVIKPVHKREPVYYGSPRG